MTKRFVQPGFLSGLVLGVIIAGVAFSVVATQGAPAAQAGPVTQAAPVAPVGQAAPAGQGRGQRGPAAPPKPCGPNLPPEMGVNTAKNSRCFELRMYTVDHSRVGQGNFKGGIDDLHKRFREGEVEVFKKSGVDVVAVWQNLDDPDTLIYLLAYEDRVARDAGWAKFNVDPKWTELRNKYFVPLTTKTFMMSSTDYSPFK